MVGTKKGLPKPMWGIPNFVRPMCHRRPSGSVCTKSTSKTTQNICDSLAHMLEHVSDVAYVEAYQGSKSLAFLGSTPSLPGNLSFSSETSCAARTVDDQYQSDLRIEWPCHCNIVACNSKDKSH
jgi:hypothetical protein